VKQILLMAGLLVMSPIYASAQVTVNPAALQQLAGIEPPPPVVVETAMPVHYWTHSTHHTGPAAPKPTEPVQVSAHVPPPHEEAPAAPKPTLAPALPATPKPAAPVSLVFAPDSSDLPANATTALKPFCTAPGQVAINARAPAVTSDPSAAMRLSLSRAIAVQAALTACGVPPQNILPRALGAVPGQNEDETVIGSGAQ
jgi:OmpA family